MWKFLIAFFKMLGVIDSGKSKSPSPAIKIDATKSLNAQKKLTVSEFRDGDGNVIKMDATEVDWDDLIKIPANANVPNFIDENKDMIYRRLLEKFELMVDDDDVKVIAFMIHGNSYVLGITRASIDTGLKNILDYFVETEQYELASKTNLLIKKL